MVSDPKSVLNEVFPHMLEELTFLFADPDEGRAGMPHDAVLVSISFSGPMSGAIEMGIARSLGVEMASNLLALDPLEASSKRAGDDALRELMNVTCGHVLTAIAGSEPVFNLTIPTVKQIDGSEWDKLAHSNDVVLFNIDSRPVQVCLTIQS